MVSHFPGFSFSTQIKWKELEGFFSAILKDMLHKITMEYDEGRGRGGGCERVVGTWLHLSMTLILKSILPLTKFVKFTINIF